MQGYVSGKNCCSGPMSVCVLMDGILFKIHLFLLHFDSHLNIFVLNLTT